MSNSVDHAHESSWKLLRDLKQLPVSHHDSYTPAVLHDQTHECSAVLDEYAPPVLDVVGDAEEELEPEQARGVKRKVSEEDEHSGHGPLKRAKHADPDPTPPRTVHPASAPLAPVPLVVAPKPKPDVMGPLIPAKKFTVDNFLGTVADASTAQPLTAHTSARQRINPSSQQLSSATCPIVPYTPNSHIERAVRQKVVDRLYAHLTRVNASEAVQQALDLELEIYRSCQGRTSYLHQSRVLFSELERK